MAGDTHPFSVPSGTPVTKLAGDDRDMRWWGKERGRINTNHGHGVVVRRQAECELVEKSLCDPVKLWCCESEAGR